MKINELTRQIEDIEHQVGALTKSKVTITTTSLSEAKRIIDEEVRGKGSVGKSLF